MRESTTSRRRAPAGPAAPRWLKEPWPEDLYPPRRSLLFVLSGPSGVGKDAIISALKLEGYPLHFAVTATTRPRRPDETPGVSYSFVEPAEFARLRESGELLEWANVHGYEYGTPRRQVEEALGAGKDVLLKIDVQGAASVRERAPESVLIFVGPATRGELAERLAQRNTEADEYLQRRIRNAEAELRAAGSYDYVVINRQGQLAQAVSQVKAIIEAERLRVRPREVDLG